MESESDYGYTKQAQKVLLNKCRKSCESCEEDSTCSDDKSFKDASGFNCFAWRGYDCNAAEKDYGYTKQAQKVLLNKCRKSCESCEEDNMDGGDMDGGDMDGGDMDGGDMDGGDMDGGDMDGGDMDGGDMDGGIMD